jgi:hypothetical protein
MKKLLLKPWEILKSLFGLAFPMFYQGGSATAAGSLGTWAARALLMTVILGGLAWLNQWEKLGLLRRIAYGPIRNLWLPVFAFCSYAMIWLGWLLYRVLSIDVGPVTSEFPDIDRAWSQALEALARASIQLESTPLFLILGSSTGGEESLFQAAGFRAEVKQVPRDQGEPLHVTANQNAVWVTCPGASVLGQIPLLGSRSAESTLETLTERASDPFETVGAGGGGATMRIEDFAASLAQAEARQRSAQRKNKVLDTDRETARIRYLCRLIARERHGFCPINGILIVLPITAAGPTRTSEELGVACKLDVAEAFGIFPMRCPVIVLVSDLEKIEGFETLIERLPAGQSRKRMGQRFPLAPELEPGAVPARIEDSVSWIGNNLFYSMVYSLFKVETPGGEDVKDLLKANSQLYRFLAALRDRNARIARLVKQSLPDLPGEPVLYGGCYFAATGADSGTGQAFTSGVLNRLVDDQDHVTWTADTLSEDASLLKLARAVKIGLLTMIAIVVTLIAVRIAYRFVKAPDQPANDVAYSVSPRVPRI